MKVSIIFVIISIHVAEIHITTIITQQEHSILYLTKYYGDIPSTSNPSTSPTLPTQPTTVLISRPTPSISPSLTNTNADPPKELNLLTLNSKPSS